jgi:flavin-dependent dehydrogenase
MKNPITIIGGGLFGLGLANGLRQFGVPVLLLEANSYPRHRVCGEFISGLSDQTLKMLGIGHCLDDALPHNSTAWYRQGKCVRRYELPHPARGISRFTLDARLATKVIESGGRLQTHTRATLTPESGHVIGTGRRTNHRGMYGLKSHWGNLETEADLELHLGRGAYLGISKVEGGFTNTCGLFTSMAEGSFGSPLKRFLATLADHGLGYLLPRLKTATHREGSFCSVSGLAYHPSAGTGFGDHRQLIPPFTGHGMTLALEAAETALPHLVNYAQGVISWHDFQTLSGQGLHRRHKGRYFRSRLLHPLILNPTLQAVTVAAAKCRLLPFDTLYKLTHS